MIKEATQRTLAYILLHALLAIVVACAPTPLGRDTGGSSPVPSLEPCELEPIVVPTPPAEIPGYADLDPNTGLHVTGTPPEIDFAGYRLAVTGKIDSPLSLTYDELRCLPRTERLCVLNCPGFFQDEATWAGAPLDHILDLAGVQEDAERLRLVSADGYSAILFLRDLDFDGSFLAYEWEGEPLPIIHGFPVRAVFPTFDGNKWVKWLVEIQVD